jgi:hypothetical protein
MGGFPYSDLQILPRTGEAVARSASLDRALSEVVRDLEEALMAWGPPSSL